MPDNPLELGVKAGASKLVGDLEAIDRSVGRVAPLGRRLMTQREVALDAALRIANGEPIGPGQARAYILEMRRKKG